MKFGGKYNRSLREVAVALKKDKLQVILAIMCLGIISLLVPGCSKSTNNDIVKLADVLKGKEAILYPVKIDGKWGFIDKTGHIEIQPQFDLGEDFANVFDGTYYPVKQNNKWGFIDKEGKMVIQPQFYRIYGGFSEGLAAVDISGGIGFIDEKGTIVIGSQHYKRTLGFHEGLAIMEPFDRFQGWDVIDTTGKVVVKIGPNKTPYAIYPVTVVAPFSEGLTPVETNGKWGFSDKSGVFVIPAQYIRAGSLSEGLAFVSDGETSGFIDKSGNMVLQGSWMPPITTSTGYVHCERFSEGLAAVCINDKYGYIDKTGQMQIQPQFEMAGPFKDGLALVFINNKAALIDTSGNYIVQAPNDSTTYQPLNGGIIRMKISGPTKNEFEYRYLNSKGGQIWPKR